MGKRKLKFQIDVTLSTVLACSLDQINNLLVSEKRWQDHEPQSLGILENKANIVFISNKRKAGKPLSFSLKFEIM